MGKRLCNALRPAQVAAAATETTIHGLHIGDHATDNFDTARFAFGGAREASPAALQLEDLINNGLYYGNLDHTTTCTHDLIGGTTGAA